MLLEDGETRTRGCKNLEINNFTYPTLLQPFCEPAFLAPRYPRPPCAPSFITSRTLRILLTHFLLFWNSFYIYTRGILGCLLGFWFWAKTLRGQLAFRQCFRSSNSYMTHLLSRENEHELCLFGRLSSKIIRGPSLSENDRHLCLWDERITSDSFWHFRQKTLHSVSTNYVVNEVRARDKASCRILVPSFHSLRMEHLGPPLATKKLAFYDSGPTEARVKIEISISKKVFYYYFI